MDYNKKLVRIRSFSKQNIEIATKVYNQIENKTDSSKNTVLVSASSFDALRMAYPNYFTDIQEFVDMMRNLYKNINTFIKQDR